MVDTGSPYQNTRPGVKYVGDAACIRCHAEIGESYRLHPMGRSLSPITPATASRVENTAGAALFEAGGLQYSIENRGGHVIHLETRRAASGGIVAQSTAEVQFTLGSGRQALAYLIERDGFLFQSPITRYVRAERWDLSPGYEKKNLHFERPVLAGCLFCHVNRVENVAGTVNRYERADLPGLCDRLRAVPRSGRASRPAARRWSTAATSRSSTRAPSSPRCVMRSASNVT